MTELRTERLILRPAGPDDVGGLLALFNEPDVGRYLLDGERVDRPWVAAEVEASMRRFGNGTAGLWTLRPLAGGARRGSIADHDEVLGIVGYRPFFDPPELQLLYALHPSEWGRGLAVESARAAVRHAFETLGHDEVRAATDGPNEASIRVLEELGMRRWKLERGDPWDTLFYRVRREEWSAATSPRPPAAPPP